MQEAIHSVVTIKRALNRSVYKGIKQRYRIAIYYKGSFGDKVKHGRQITKLLNKESSLLTNIVLSKFVSILCYSKFGSLYEFLCSAFSVRNDCLFNFLLSIMTSAVIDFNVLEGNERGATDKKQADHIILYR